MRPFRSTLLLLLIFMLILPMPWAYAGAPTEVVRQAIANVLDILRGQFNQDPGQKSQRQQKVKATVEPLFDFQEMAKRALGSTWNTLSSSQKDDFVRLFGDLLEASYSDKIEKYVHHVKVDYTGEILEGTIAEVKTVVTRPNDRIPLTYRLIQGPNGWKIYDVVIEGVSLVNNYRSQFSRIMQQSSYGELVRRLRNKVQELKMTESM